MSCSEYNGSALQNYKGILIPFACGLGHEGLLEHGVATVILNEYLMFKALVTVCQILQGLAESCLGKW